MSEKVSELPQLPQLHELYELPIVVIGGGISGVSCIQQLAQEFTQTPLILISASDLIKVVSNVKRIGQTIDAFDVTEESNHYLINKYKNLEIIIEKVIELNAREHGIRLESGRTVNYQKLCVCLGAKPALIPMSADIDISHYILGIRDTQTVCHFENRLKNAKRVLIVGNGGIATELVHQITNCEIIWCIKDDSFGAPYFDAMTAKFFESRLNRLNGCSTADSDSLSLSKSNISKRLKYSAISPLSSPSPTSPDQPFGTALGPDWSQSLTMSGADTRSVRIEYNCEVIEIYSSFESISDSKKLLVDSNESNVWPVFVELSNGRIYGSDLIVSATGVTPNTDALLKGNNLKVGSDGGLVVSQEMLTSEDDVYAAGDVCSAGWPTSQHWFQMRLWTQARQMGVYAAQCMAAHLNHTSAELYFQFDLFAHMTHFFGYKVVLLGLYNAQNLEPSQCQTLVRVSPDHQFVKVVLSGGRLMGSVLVGETGLEETFENLILNQIDLSSFGDDFLNTTVDIDDYFD